MEDNKNIGIWWLKHQLKTPAGRKIKGEIWWGVCKKTRNVAFAVFCNNTIHAMAPMIIQDTNIEEGKCFDGKSCLNIDCPYAESKTLIHAINKTNFFIIIITSFPGRCTANINTLTLYHELYSK